MTRLPGLLLMIPLPPPVHGAALMSRQIAESRLLRKHFRVRVLPLRFTTSLASLGRFSPIKAFRTIIITLKLLKELVFYRPALVYVVVTPGGYSHYRDLSWAWLLRLFRIRRLCSVRERGFQEASGRFAHWRMRQLFHGAHAMVTSPLVKSDISPWVAPERLHAVANGIPDLPEHERRRTPLKPPMLLFLSNLMINKGVFVLLDAAARLRKRGLAFQLVLAGSCGRDIRVDDLKKRIVDLQLTSRVKIIGAVDEPGKSLLLRQAAMLVFPTLKEAFGNVLLEAMRIGLPVVATREGSIPWIVSEGKSGLLCRKSDAPDLATCIERLLINSELRAQVGRAGRQRFLENFTIEQFENRLLRALRIALGKKAC
ncbi:MAG: glycosyltransferase family 4 protein [Acidobacteriota bacterium]|jgi:glycosyltransferase involved in cell wall biosynthesis|nr:glycosyltransferase family 4 protein [Acidobacteriota bacterium]